MHRHFGILLAAVLLAPAAGAGCADDTDASAVDVDVASGDTFGSDDRPADTGTPGADSSVTDALSEDGGDTTDALPEATADIGDDTVDAEADAGEERRFPRLDQLLADLRGLENRAARANRIATFRHAIAYGESGFPLRSQVGEKTALAFVFFDPDDQSGELAVSGAFSDWNPWTMNRPIDDLPLYVYRTEPLELTGEVKYKFVRAPGTADATWFADPNARMYGYDEHGEYALASAGSESGHLERWPQFDREAGDLAERTLRVYVPGAYPEGRDAFPLLVMHDGQNLFDPGAIHGGWQVDRAADEAIANGDVPPFLIVGIPNTPARMDEYTHVEDEIQNMRVGGRADTYAAFVADGVVPFVRESYENVAGPERTAVLGSSLGGLVSLYIAHAHPNAFGYAGSMSGTLAWGEFAAGNPTIIDRYRNGPPTGLDIYLDSGGARGIECDGLWPTDPNVDHDNYCSTLAMRDLLTSNGWSRGDDLRYRWQAGAGHNERAWASRFPDLLRTWFPGE